MFLSNLHLSTESSRLTLMSVIVQIKFICFHPICQRFSPITWQWHWSLVTNRLMATYLIAKLLFWTHVLCSCHKPTFCFYSPTFSFSSSSFQVFNCSRFEFDKKNTIFVDVLKLTISPHFVLWLALAKW